MLVKRYISRFLVFGKLFNIPSFNRTSKSRGIEVNAHMRINIQITRRSCIPPHYLVKGSTCHRLVVHRNIVVEK